jgi:hypothetical protein
MRPNRKETWWNEEAFAYLRDDESESFAEEMLATVTSGEYIAEDAINELTDEEALQTT